MHPQLLRRTVPPVTLDVPEEGQPDFSYQADPCRTCAHYCDRHLIHAHNCPKSKSNIRVRHDYVKEVRVKAVKEAGYVEVVAENRTDPTRDQKRADVSYVDASKRQHIHYVTDDTIGHPFCPSNTNVNLHDKLRKKKEKEYAEKLATLRNSRAVILGLIVVVFWPITLTSLGEYGEETIKFINAAAGFLKHNAVCDPDRDDGLSPQRLSARFRFSLRAKIQVAILKGNGRLGTSVGL